MQGHQVPGGLQALVTSRSCCPATGHHGWSTHGGIYHLDPLRGPFPGLLAEGSPCRDGRRVLHVVLALWQVCGVGGTGRRGWCTRCNARVGLGVHNYFISPCLASSPGPRIAPLVFSPWSSYLPAAVLPQPRDELPIRASGGSEHGLGEDLSNSWIVLLHRAARCGQGIPPRLLFPL